MIPEIAKFQYLQFDTKLKKIDALTKTTYMRADASKRIV